MKTKNQKPKLVMAFFRPTIVLSDIDNAMDIYISIWNNYKKVNFPSLIIKSQL